MGLEMAGSRVLAIHFGFVDLCLGLDHWNFSGRWLLRRWIGRRSQAIVSVAEPDCAGRGLLAGAAAVLRQLTVDPSWLPDRAFTDYDHAVWRTQKAVIIVPAMLPTVESASPFVRLEAAQAAERSGDGALDFFAFLRRRIQSGVALATALQNWFSAACYGVITRSVQQRHRLSLFPVRAPLPRAAPHRELHSSCSTYR